MRRLRRKNANKELSALARLNDRDIDTSEIPEIKDWSNAIVGRFYKSGEQRIFPRSLNAGTFARNVLVGLESANIQRTDATGITELTNGEIVKACIKGTPKAWEEFLRRFHRLIAAMVMQTSRQWSVQSPEQIDDLVQEVYLRLCADDYRLLKMYKGDYENSFFGYLKVVASNVAYEQLRPLGSFERRIEIGDLPLELNAALAAHAKSATSLQEKVLSFAEIESILKTTTSENERAIFWLYYRDGFSAAAIAALPAVNLTRRGVESLLHRLTSRIKSELTKQNPKPQRP